MRQNYDANQQHDEIMLWLDANIEKVIWIVLAKRSKVVKKIWELPVEKSFHGKRWIAGFIDLAAELKDKTSIHFEVKSYIPSLGQLIRQIRFYQSVHPADRVIVVSPDTRFAATLRSQDFSFYECNIERIKKEAKEQEDKKKERARKKEEKIWQREHKKWLREKLPQSIPDFLKSGGKL
jgi:hypothetical protein